MAKNYTVKEILEAHKRGIEEGKNSTPLSRLFDTFGSWALPANEITNAEELGRKEGIEQQTKEIEEREKEEEERVSAIEEARQEIMENLCDSLSRRYSDDSYSEPSEVNGQLRTQSSRRYSDVGSYSLPSNTNIGGTAERDTSWGVAFIIIAVIIFAIILVIKLIPSLLQHHEPEPTSFSVRIDSSPSGGKVFIDKKQVGVTPFSTTLEKGSYGIRVEKEGYKSAYEITEGGNREFNFKLKEE